MLQKINKSLILLTGLSLSLTSCNFWNYVSGDYTKARENMITIFEEAKRNGTHESHVLFDGMIQSKLHFHVGYDSYAIGVFDYFPADNNKLGDEDVVFVSVLKDLYKPESTEEMDKFQNVGFNDHFSSKKISNYFSLPKLYHFEKEEMSTLEMAVGLIQLKNESFPEKEFHPSFASEEQHLPEKSGIDKYFLSKKELYDLLVLSKNSYIHKLYENEIGFAFNYTDSLNNKIFLIYTDVKPFDYLKRGIIGREDLLEIGKLDSMGVGKLFGDEGVNGLDEKDWVQVYQNYNEILKYNMNFSAHTYVEAEYSRVKFLIKELKENCLPVDNENNQILFKQL